MLKENIRLKDISWQLYSRSMHRMFGNPTIGTLTSFLTVIFIIRQSVNLYFVFIFSSGQAEMDLPQIASGWFLFISAYFILCSSLSAFHVSFALPTKSFTGISSGGKKFRSDFLRHAAIVRPMNIAMLILSASALFIFIRAAGSPRIILSAAPLFISAFAALLVFRLGEKISPGMTEVQVIEAVLIGAIVSLNPDVILIKEKIYMLLNGIYLDFSSPKIMLACIILPASAVCLLLFLLRLISVLNGFLHRHRLKTGPILSWYFHFFKITYWLAFYLIAIPLLYSDIPVQNFDQKIIPLYGAVSLIAWIAFILNCENRIRTVFRRSILNRKNLPLIVKPLLVHLALTIAPLLFRR